MKQSILGKISDVLGSQCATPIGDRDGSCFGVYGSNVLRITHHVTPPPQTVPSLVRSHSIQTLAEDQTSDSRLNSSVSVNCQTD